MKLRVNRIILLVSLLTYDCCFARSAEHSVSHAKGPAFGNDPTSESWESSNESGGGNVYVGRATGSQVGSGTEVGEVDGGTSIANGSYDQNTDAALTLLNKMTISASGIPFVGSFIVGFLNQISTIVKYIEEITNGLVGRILGGALPCTISLKDGMQCRGIQQRGGLSKVITSIIDNLPAMFLPFLLSKLTALSLDTVVNPMADVLFGGVQKN